MVYNPTAMKAASAIAFDLDGTLVDSREDLVAAMSWLLSRLGHPPKPEDELISYVGRGVRQFVARSMPQEASRDAAAVDGAVELFKDYYGGRLAESTRPYQGVPEALDALSGAGVPMWVLTNKPGYMARDLLGALEMADLFRGILGAGDFPGHKPDPAGLLEICRRLDKPPAEVWYVGDMAIDVETARRAGSPCALVTWGYCGDTPLREASPDRALRSPEELLELVPARGGRTR